MAAPAGRRADRGRLRRRQPPRRAATLGLVSAPPGASPYLGLEVAGTVIAVGPEATRWQVGDRVCALTPGGGYAQYCLADERHCLPVPRGLDLLSAAAIPENYFTV